MIFENLYFKDNGEHFRVEFLKNWYFHIPKEEMEGFSVDGNKIEGNEKKLMFLISKYMKNLKSAIGDKHAVYIHQNSGIPLIGNPAFGIVDRNTSLIEVKPNTGCNLNCVYCSVDEGVCGKKQRDYVVEEEYLFSVFKEIAEFKGCEVEAHINPQGEPLLYGDIVRLVKDLASVSKKVSMNTNGVLLDEEIVDRLIDAGISCFNISVNSLDKRCASRLAGAGYDAAKIEKVMRYIASKRKLLIAPLWVPGYNDQDIEELVKFAKETGCEIGIQNYLEHKHGRKPAKQRSWEEFFSLLEALEKKYKIKLLKTEKDFDIVKTKKLAMPFRKGDNVNCIIVAEGRVKGEMIGSASERCISIMNCHKKIGDKAKVKITRSKHNIFIGSI